MGIRKLYLIILVIYLGLAAGLFFYLKNSEAKSYQERNVFINRFTTLVSASDKDISTEYVTKLYKEGYEKYSQEYCKDVLPESITYTEILNPINTVYSVKSGSVEQRVSLVTNSNGEITGILTFQYMQSDNSTYLIYGLILAASLVIIIIVILYIQKTILKPFNDLTDYAVKISKNEIRQKLPETKNKNFGKFIWGVNMLSDQIAGDKERIGKLMKERQTMLTTIAHGIKTPVSNITLYASSIETGLYQTDKKPNEVDADIARKIQKNASDINVLVEEMINTSSTSMVDFEPDIKPFYIKEIEDFIRDEYQGRLDPLHIPLEIQTCNNCLIDSDKSGIVRILTQLMENAIKYGDGTGIKVSLDKGDDGYYFSVSNKGKPLPDNEIPYIFNSFWRGSNAENVKGSGIGLFEARTIAGRLGGDIYVKCQDDSMEFTLYIEKEI